MKQGFERGACCLAPRLRICPISSNVIRHHVCTIKYLFILPSIQTLRSRSQLQDTCECPAPRHYAVKWGIKSRVIVCNVRELHRMEMLRGRERASGIILCLCDAAPAAPARRAPWGAEEPPHHATAIQLATFCPRPPCPPFLDPRSSYSCSFRPRHVMQVPVHGPRMAQDAVISESSLVVLCPHRAKSVPV
jgi:hypothetical protein